MMGQGAAHHDLKGLTPTGRNHLWPVMGRDEDHGHFAQVRILSQPLQHLPATDVWQGQVEKHGIWRVSA